MPVIGTGSPADDSFDSRESTESRVSRIISLGPTDSLSHIVALRALAMVLACMVQCRRPGESRLQSLPRTIASTTIGSPDE